MDLLFIEFLLVNGAPGVDDVSQNEGHEQRDIEHRGQRELTRARVLDGQRRLKIGGRGIVGRVVPASAEQQGEDDEHGADAGRPDAAIETFREDGLADAEEHEHDTYQ